MEEIINSVMQSPENTNPNVLRGQLQKMGGGSGGGVLMVTDTNGTLDKTMGEIQDAYLAGKRVIISDIINDINRARDIIGIYPVYFEEHEYGGAIETYNADYLNQNLTPKSYSVLGETEEAARNAYPKNEDK